MQSSEESYSVKYGKLEEMSRDNMLLSTLLQIFYTSHLRTVKSASVDAANNETQGCSFEKNCGTLEFLRTRYNV
jgi:hypothetical protein